ncbi:MAG: Ig-like domain-containing protein [Deltaproteobacteria bacterium]|jgi:hypothetical protein|nr:Ig-like domain-containing protein [Deltaproteobacteria bacterium]
MAWSKSGRVDGGFAAVLGIALAALTASCGSDDNGGTAGAGGQGAAGGTGGAGGGVTGDSITVRVYLPGGADDEGVPTEGATVAFDAPGGERTEATTGADGRAIFTGIDWSAGSAGITAYYPDHVMLSSVNVDEARIEDWVDDEGDLPMHLTPLTGTPPDTVTVSGTATGLQDTAHMYVVNIFGARDAPFVDGSEWVGEGTEAFSITVPRGVSFSLQSFEFDFTPLASGQGYDRPIYQVMRMDLGPVDTDQASVVLDFAADAVTTHTADVAMNLPARPESPLHGGEPYCFTCAANSYYCEGWPTHLDISADTNQFDISFLWYEPPNIEGPDWFCRVSTDEGMASQVVDGYPQDGVDGTMMDVPRWVTPSDPTTRHPLHELLEWEWFDEDVATSSVEILRNSPVWWIRGGPDATSITVPALPSSVDGFALLGTNPRAKVYGGTYNEATRSWDRYAESQLIPVAP